MSQSPPDKTRTKPENTSVPQTTTFRQAVLLILVATGLFFALVEGGLALFGVQSAMHDDDPFVGFAGNVPLYVENTLPDGQTIMATATNKLTFFNQQQFTRDKADGTYRIFCLGGSTTYGRPYNDLTSFAGWLRELLPAVDTSRKWEVINAGGISYASYRVARLMEELVRYQPDLFIVYTGQNEFLEERSYGKLREMPEFIRTTVGLLARTRTWTAMNSALGKLGLVPEQIGPERVELAAEVDTILDHSAGPSTYQRDDALRDDVLDHYRVSLERMAEIARQAGAHIVFVTPASNLGACSPFKSEHTAGLDEAGKKRSQVLSQTAESSLQATDVAAALGALDEAIALDPRHAELHYRRGRVLFSLGRFDEALQAFEQARDEDICPLRALTPMRRIVTDVAHDQGVPVVDYVALLEQRLLDAEGHRIPGEESFLDHVHPTIDGHRLLAVELVEVLIDQGVVRPSPGWTDAAVASASAHIEGSLDPYLQAKGLLNLTKVMSWARKTEEARRAARETLVVAQGYPHFTAEASMILMDLAIKEGNSATAERYIREALAADPWNPQNHYQLGMRRLRVGQGQAGAAHILLASALWGNIGQTDSLLGMILHRNGRPGLAYPYLVRAVRRNPNDRVAQQALAQLRQTLGAAADQLPVPAIIVRRTSSDTPGEVFMQSAETAVSGLPDGIYTEWHANGSLKRYAEYDKGVLHGVTLLYDQDGKLVSRLSYRHGMAVGG